MLFRCLTTAFLFAPVFAVAQPPDVTDAPVLESLHQHIAYLASDSLQGRRTGTRGERLAAAYISTEFGKAGLSPKGTTGYYQAFPVGKEKGVNASSFLAINGTLLQQGKDWFPINGSANGYIDAAAAIPKKQFADLSFIDLAATLQANTTNPHFDVAEFINAEASMAADSGAKGIIIYNRSALPDGLRFDDKDRTATASIPIIYLTKTAADALLNNTAATTSIKANIAIDSRTRTGTNVVGYINNNAATTVVLGAHYDHLGFGEDGNSRYTGAEKKVHNGADDNASGVAALIELGKKLKTARGNSNYLLIAFSGEELGLFGSKYFVQNPTIELRTVNYMVNMDMVGRLSDSLHTLTVGGYGTSPLWGRLYGTPAALSNWQLQFRFDSSGTGPSDHTSFYQKNIPVLFYFTGLHTDYHKPTDDFEKINYTGELQVVAHIYSLLQATDKLNTRLAFTKTREAQSSTTARFSVTMGIMPDYTFTGAGVRVDGVSDGRPAQKAGLQTGDVITAIGDYKTASLEGYMQTLGKFKKGDKTTVTYNRAGQSLTATVEF